MRLARGAGPAALGGMRPAGPGPFIRPLLAVERAELRAWLRRQRVAWREDESNRSLAFDRNRVRRLIVPVLTQHLNPRAAHHLVEAAARVREDAAYLDALAASALETASSTANGAYVLDAEALCTADRPIAARMARMALEARRRRSTQDLGAARGGAAGAGGVPPRSLGPPATARGASPGNRITLTRA